LVEVVESAEAAAASAERTPGADRFQYHLAIEDERGQRELTLGEDQLPPQLREAIERGRRA
jgi:Emfourin